MVKLWELNWLKKSSADIKCFPLCCVVSKQSLKSLQERVRTGNPKQGNIIQLNLRIC